MIFENPQVDIEALPSVGEVEFSKLAPNYRSVEYISTAIFFGFLLIGCVIAYFNIPDRLSWLKILVFVVWVLVFSLSMILAGKQYNRAGYALREKDVIYKHGVWWHTVTTVPFNRMQHCEISQGPIQSAFGLATLRIFTAGGTSSDMAIDGLSHKEALRIKDFVTGKIVANTPLEAAAIVPDESEPAESENPPSNPFTNFSEE